MEFENDLITEMIRNGGPPEVRQAVLLFTLVAERDAAEAEAKSLRYMLSQNAESGGEDLTTGSVSS